MCITVWKSWHWVFLLDIRHLSLLPNGSFLPNESCFLDSSAKASSSQVSKVYFIFRAVIFLCNSKRVWKDVKLHQRKEWALHWLSWFDNEGTGCLKSSGIWCVTGQFQLFMLLWEAYYRVYCCCLYSVKSLLLTWVYALCLGSNFEDESQVIAYKTKIACN